MSELFKRYSRGEYSKMLVDHGISNIEVGDAIRLVEDIFILSDGMKPVYVFELSPEASPDGVEYLSEALADANLVAVLIPPKQMKVKGVVTYPDWVGKAIDPEPEEEYKGDAEEIIGEKE